MQNRANLSQNPAQIRLLVPSNDYTKLSQALRSISQSTVDILRNDWKTCLKHKLWQSLSALLDAKVFNFRPHILMNQEFAVNKRLKKIEQHLIDTTAHGITSKEANELGSLLISLTKFRTYISDVLRIQNEHLVASYHIYPDHPLKPLFFCYGVIDINLDFSSISLIKNYLLSKMVNEFATMRSRENNRQLRFDFEQTSTCIQAQRYILQIDSEDQTCFRLFITCKAVELANGLDFERTIQLESDRIAKLNMERKQSAW